MCVNIEVILPIIQNFLLLYSLRSGSILIFVWTLLRSVFCIIFTTTAILETLIGAKFPLGAWLVTAQQKPGTDDVYWLYYTQVALLLCEWVLTVFLTHLGVGIVQRKPRLLAHFLICRFFTWLTEVACLSTLCVIHEVHIGWYLGILFFVVLEFYSFIVVYSYFVEMQRIENKISHSTE